MIICNQILVRTHGVSDQNNRVFISIRLSLNRRYLFPRENVSLVHLRIGEFLSDFFFEVNKLLLNIRVNEPLSLEWATCQSNLIPVSEHLAIQITRMSC
jgi:hypothetical protein